MNGQEAVREFITEMKHLQHENDLWFQAVKKLMPYVQHLHFCRVTPCSCGMIGIITTIKERFEATL